MNFGTVWPEIILAAVGMALILLDVIVPKQRQRALGLVAVLGMVGSGVAAAFEPRNGALALGGMIILDPLSLFFRLLFLAGALLVTLFSVDYIRGKGRDLAEFLALVCFATTGAMILAISWNVVSLFVGLELLSISAYVLAGFLRDEPKSNEAGLKYFLNGALASSVLLFGLSLVYGVTGQTGIPEIAKALVTAQTQGYSTVALMGLGMVLVGLGFKIAAVPFHLWAPDAYEGSPTPIAGFLSVVAEGAGIAAIIRLVSVAMGPLEGSWGVWLGALSILTMTVGNVTALWQKNIKRMLAYSSVAQVGYILAGLAVGTTAGIGAVLFYLAAYLFMTMGAFTVIASLSSAGQGNEISDYAGLGVRSPILAVLLTIFMASLLGIPATAGFMGKLSLIGAAVHGGMAWLAVGIAVNSAISVAYYWLVARTMWLDPVPEKAEPIRRSAELGAALVVTTVGTLFLGILPQVVFFFANWASVGIR